MLKTSVVTVTFQYGEFVVRLPWVIFEYIFLDIPWRIYAKDLLYILTSILQIWQQYI